MTQQTNTDELLRQEFERHASYKNYLLHYDSANQEYYDDESQAAWLAYQACNTKRKEESKAPRTISAVELHKAVMAFLMGAKIFSEVHGLGVTSNIENPYESMQAALATLGITVREND